MTVIECLKQQEVVLTQIQLNWWAAMPRTDVTEAVGALFEIIANQNLLLQKLVKEYEEDESSS